MYSDLNVSKLAMNRSMGKLSPRRMQRSSCILTWMWAYWQCTGAWADSALGIGKDLHVSWPECEHTGNEQEHGLAQPQVEAKILMYSDLNVSILAKNRSMGWLSPRGGKDLHVFWPECEQAGNVQEQGLAQPQEEAKIFATTWLKNRYRDPNITLRNANDYHLVQPRTETFKRTICLTCHLEWPFAIY
jgi:hypothetical protein